MDRQELKGLVETAMFQIMYEEAGDTSWIDSERLSRLAESVLVELEAVGAIDVDEDPRKAAKEEALAWERKPSGDR